MNTPKPSAPGASHAIAQALTKIAHVRKNTPALQRGLQFNLELAGHKAAFYRVLQSDSAQQTALVMLNKAEEPASLSMCTLLFKPDAFKADFDIHYIGKEIPNKFILGYGLDYDEYGRNLADIYQII